MATVADVLDFLTKIGQVRGPVDASAAAREIAGVQPDKEARPGAVSWLSKRQFDLHPERAELFRGTLLLGPAAIERQAPGSTVVGCVNPKLAFIRVVDHFLPAATRIEWPGPEDGGIHPTARLGNRVRLAPGVVLGSDVEIDDDVRVGPNTVLANCRLGSRSVIGANCTIGLPGFGYEKDETGRFWRFPHVGRVLIDEDVEIGSNTCIDRGALGNTAIRARVRIDNLVHVAHNVTIGSDSLVIANSMLGGSTTLGENVWIAPSVSVKNQVTIGDFALLGMGAVVLKDVESSTVVVGNPARRLDKEGRQ